MLAALPLFAGLPKSIVDAAVTEIDWMSLPGGRVLFDPEHRGSDYFVVSGCLGVYASGGERIAARGRRNRRECLIVSRPEPRRAGAARSTRDAVRGHVEGPAGTGIDPRLARLTVFSEERTELRTQDTPARWPGSRRCRVDLTFHTERCQGARALRAWTSSTAARPSPVRMVPRTRVPQRFASIPPCDDTPWTRLCLRSRRRAVRRRE